MEKVAVVFGCATSVSRKSVVPVFEELNGLLHYPASYEGEELSRNVFYTGSVATQRALPVVDFLMGQGAKRFVLLGTDYVYPRITNQILRAYLTSQGVNDADILELYTPFGFTRYEPIVSDIEKFGPVTSTAVVSTLLAESSQALQAELSKHNLPPTAPPVLSLSAGELEAQSMSLNPRGDLASANYFMSLANPVNAAWKAAWAAYQQKHSPAAVALPTNASMEAAWIGVHLWKQAVEKARSTRVDKVVAAMAGQKYNAPDGFTVEMDAKNHHLHRPLFIARSRPDRQFDLLWISDGLLKPQPWSPFIIRKELRADEPEAKRK
jgi:urea transport system substrate-binding protein